MKRNERIFPIFLGISEAPIQRKQPGTRQYAVGSQITADQIVRCHREEKATRDDSERMRNAEFGMRNDPARIPRLPGTRRKRLRCAWHAVNWGAVLEAISWAALIGCLIYLGIVVFAPFALRFVWE